MDQTHTPPPNDSELRRERLSAQQSTPRGMNHRHSRMVRSLRLILPMVSVIIIAIVFIWGEIGGNDALPVQDDAKAPKRATIGKNELLAPRFESKDAKQQPFTITAQRAIQGEGEEGLLILEKPLADILLTSGTWVAIEADQGAYREDIGRLLLKGNVQAFHDAGYQFQSTQLHVDLKNNYAWSEENVYAQGPAGTIQGTGMKASGQEERLTVQGPAKLVLNTKMKGLN